MNSPNQNQHFVSQVLLKRFKIPGHPLQCYQVKTGRWIEKSPKTACSAIAYNQLMVSGEGVNSALEDSFSKVESFLPKTFKALEEAAYRESTQLTPAIHENMCLYCTFLQLTSLFAKASGS